MRWWLRRKALEGFERPLATEPIWLSSSHMDVANDKR
jgi:hypothetical protein